MSEGDVAGSERFEVVTARVLAVDTIEYLWRTGAELRGLRDVVTRVAEGPRSRASRSRHGFNHVVRQSLPRPPHERLSLPATALASRILHRSDVHSLALPETVERAQSV